MPINRMITWTSTVVKLQRFHLRWHLPAVREKLSNFGYRFCMRTTAGPQHYIPCCG